MKHEELSAAEAAEIAAGFTDEQKTETWERLRSLIKECIDGADTTPDQVMSADIHVDDPAGLHPAALNALRSLARHEGAWCLNDLDRGGLAPYALAGTLDGLLPRIKVSQETKRREDAFKKAQEEYKKLIGGITIYREAEALRDIRKELIRCRAETPVNTPDSFKYVNRLPTGVICKLIDRARQLRDECIEQSEALKDHHEASSAAFKLGDKIREKRDIFSEKFKADHGFSDARLMPPEILKILTDQIWQMVERSEMLGRFKLVSGSFPTQKSILN